MVKVSVIMPVYNDEEYLIACMESVVSQTLKDIEILCINDGSTDGTGAILQDYGEKYPNIRVFNQKNAGAATARNRAIELALGEYVAFMDGDDYYPDNHALEILYTTAIREHVKICGGSYIQDKRGTIIRRFQDGEDCQIFLHNGRKRFSDFAFPMNFTKYIYSRKMLLECGIRFPDYSIWEDPLFLISAMTHAREFYGVIREVYVHRVGIHGYRFDYEMIIQILEAFGEAVKMAFYDNNPKLQVNCARIIFSRYYPYICCQFSQHRKEISGILSKIGPYLLGAVREETVFSYFTPYQMDKQIEDGRKKAGVLLRRVDGCETLVIYGAGDMGRMLYKFLPENQRKKILGYAVTKQEGDKQLWGLPVKEINDWRGCKGSLFIVAATPYYQREMQETLWQCGIKNIYLLDARALRLCQALAEING